MPNVPKQVKAFLLKPTPDRVGIDLSWIPNIETDLASYQISRGGSVIVAETISPTYNIIIGDTLFVSINGDKVQTITFSGLITSGAATLIELVNDINSQIKGGVAELTSILGNSSLLIRSNTNDKSGMVEITGGTANIELGFPSGKFRNNKELTKFQIISSILIINPTIFTDSSGKPHDFYFVKAITTVPLIGQSSIIRSLGNIIDEIPESIFIFGRIHNAGGIPMVNREIILAPCLERAPSLNFGLTDFLSVSNADFGISFDDHIVRTDQDGYFEIQATINTKLRLLIPSINYDRQILTTTQTQDFVALRVVG